MSLPHHFCFTFKDPLTIENLRLSKIIFLLKRRFSKFFYYENTPLRSINQELKDSTEAGALK